MALTYWSFVGLFPEFSDQFAYTQGTIDAWIAQAYANLNPRGLRAQLDLAAGLYVAHNVVLGKRETLASGNGQIAGEVRGPVVSKSIGKVSVGYATTGSIDGAGIYNATSYGQRLWALLQAAASGPKYVPGPQRVFDPFNGRRW